MCALTIRRALAVASRNVVAPHLRLSLEPATLSPLLTRLETLRDGLTRLVAVARAEPATVDA